MKNTTLCYIERDGKYLMLRRVKKKNDENHDKWIGVGGHFEEKESPYDCALREIREETGITVTLDTNFRKSVVYSPREYIQKEVVYFTAITDTRETTPQPEEIRRAEWFTFDEAAGQLTHENDKQILRSAQKYWKEKTAVGE